MPPSWIACHRNLMSAMRPASNSLHEGEPGTGERSFSNWTRLCSSLPAPYTADSVRLILMPSEMKSSSAQVLPCVRRNSPAASGLSLLICRVEALELDAGVFGREAPVDGGRGG